MRRTANLFRLSSFSHRLVRPTYLAFTLFGLYATKGVLKPNNKVSCWNGWPGTSSTSRPPAQRLLGEAVFLKRNGEVIGCAYCVSVDTFVTASPDVYATPTQAFNTTFTLQKDGVRISNSSLLGKHDNLTFIKIHNSSTKPLESSQCIPFEKVLIVDRRQYPQLREGYVVQTNPTHAILHTQAQPGAAVLFNGQLAGLVTQVGSNSLRPYRMVRPWSKIKNLAVRILKSTHTPYLGISAKDSQSGIGAFILRIASDSPLRQHIKLGDTITRINGQPIQDTKDIQRLISYSGDAIEITVNRDGRETKFTMNV